MKQYLQEYKRSYLGITFKLSSVFKEIAKEEDYSSIKCVEFSKPDENHNNKKALVVLDYVPTEDLKSGFLLSGETGTYISTLFDVASEYALPFEQNIYYKKILFVGFNLVKTVGYSEEYNKKAFNEAKKRLQNIVSKYRPDVILSFGDSYFKAISPEIEKPASRFGVPLEKKRFIHFGSFSIQTLMRGKSKTEFYLGGFVSRNIACFLCGRLPWKIPNVSYTPVLIDTISKFRKLLSVLREEKYVSIDTETENLNKIKNSLLTIQFAKCSKYAYVVPIYHKDTPFISSELNIIKKELKEFFEWNNANKYHIYTNAPFDLNVIKNFCGVRYFKNDIWDIQAGEFAIDENMKNFYNMVGYSYYSLFNLSLQHGCDAYLTSNFSKKDRVNITNTDLDDDLIEYASLDVIVPFMIFKSQIKRASKWGHDKYRLVVSKQISDAIHAFSDMQHYGEKIDLEYLFNLKLPDSPINKVINGMTEEFLKSSSVKRASKLLARESFLPKNLFNQDQNIFDLQKDKHKRFLFFDVLKLEPLEYGKSGVGKLDKNFQKEYENIPEVKMYTEIGKGKKLRDTYVNGLIKKFSNDFDFKHDNRVRSRYNYLLVVTGRLSSEDPNLQQIPSRAELGKNIKRLFIASEETLFIKVDYRVHEVRGWANISKDAALAEVFQRGMDIRKKYKENPTAELAELNKKEGDVHILNACYFFGKTIEEMTETLPEKERKELRNSVKSVVFGLIYGMSLKTLAANLGKPLEFVESLVEKFYERFPNGTSWFDKTLSFARSNFYVESPLGRRRYLWGYMLPDTKEFRGIKGGMDRRALNSPIQGMSGDFTLTGGRMLQKMLWHYYERNGRYPNIKLCNSVHDSLELEVGYSDILLCISLIEKALGSTIEREMKKRYNLDLLSSLEIDIEIGANMKDMYAWDYSEKDLREYLQKSLDFQKSIGYKNVCSVDDILKAPGAPRWLKNQRKNF